MPHAQLWRKAHVLMPQKIAAVSRYRAITALRTPEDNMEKEKVKIPPPGWELEEGYTYGVLGYCLGHSLYKLSPKYEKAGALPGDCVVSTSATGDVNSIEKAQKALAAPPGTEVMVHRVIDGELWRILLVL